MGDVKGRYSSPLPGYRSPPRHVHRALQVQPDHLQVRVSGEAQVTALPGEKGLGAKRVQSLQGHAVVVQVTWYNHFHVLPLFKHIAFVKLV